MFQQSTNYMSKNRTLVFSKIDGKLNYQLQNRVKNNFLWVGTGGGGGGNKMISEYDRTAFA